jgi:carbon-monoxide dehydrogenase iron sulfur subunit
VRGSVVINAERCVSCKRCVIQCAVEHSRSRDLLPAMSEFPLPAARIGFEIAGRKTTPIKCRHCGKAPCIPACPTSALKRADDGGPVFLDAAICTQQQHCIPACPFGQMKGGKAEKKPVYKCDECIRRLDVGQVPACVEACHTDALTFDQLDMGTRAGVSKALLTYLIDPEACTGCRLCAKNCPVKCIAGDKKKPHVIDQAACIKCGVCKDVCPKKFDAVRAELLA